MRNLLDVLIVLGVATAFVVACPLSLSAQINPLDQQIQGELDKAKGDVKALEGKPKEQLDKAKGDVKALEGRPKGELDKGGYPDSS